MGKFFGIVGMVASAFAGHWAYGEFKASNCQQSVENFRDAYKKQRGNPNRSDIAKVLKTASKHCEAGEYDQAHRLLEARAMVCRMSDDC
jgi:hypothetical protein